MLTEADWFACVDPSPMLNYLHGKANERKLLLFSVACCRRIRHLLADERSRHALEVAEWHADGLANAEEFKAAKKTAADVFNELKPTEESLDHFAEDFLPARAAQAAWHLGGDNRASYGGGSSASYAIHFAAEALAHREGRYCSQSWVTTYAAERAEQARLLRDVFGSPFRPVTVDPSWLSHAEAGVVRLADAIYAGDRFDLLPRLADELEQAGCSDKAILGHCRQSEGHVRGCWVVDALLGKEGGIKRGLTTQAEWMSCAEVLPLLQFLKGKGSDRQWRLFAVACCRRIDRFLTDGRSRVAVEVAERYADGTASAEEFEAARNGANVAEDEAITAEWEAEAEANFCGAPDYVTKLIRKYASGAARSAVARRAAEPEENRIGRQELSSYWAAAAAGAEPRVAMCAPTTGEIRGQQWQAAIDSAGHSESREQAALALDIFGAYFGSVRQESVWLPWPDDSQRWCLAPLPRIVRIDPRWLSRHGGKVTRLAEAIYEERRFGDMSSLADALEEAGCTDADILAHCRQPGEHTRGCWVVDLLLGKG